MLEPENKEDDPYSHHKTTVRVGVIENTMYPGDETNNDPGLKGKMSLFKEKNPF